MFCPYLHSLTLTFLLAPPPTQYEGSRLNEEVSEGEEGTACSVFLFPSFLGCERVGGFQMLGHSATPPLPPLTFSPCSAGISPPSHPVPPSPPGLVCVLTCLFWIPCLVCVSEQPCLLCCNPALKFPTHDAFAVRALTLLVTMHRFWGEVQKKAFQN